MITSTKVPDGKRLRTSPKHFGTRCVLVEQAVFTWACKLSATYEGGYWEFYELSNGGFYMAPDSDVPYDVAWAENYFRDTMSGDAFGITVTLYALSHLSLQVMDEAIMDHYHWLREYAIEHAEASQIFAAID